MADGARRARLRLADVAFTYSGRTPTQALDGLTLDVVDNEFLAVVGPVGCGKTTLLRLVAGFLTPARGSVLEDDRPIRGPSPTRGYVFQEEAIFPWMTVTENLAFGLRAKRVDRVARERIVHELLRLIGLEAFANAYPRELSAGMAKMVEVGRVLATEPSLLLLDEPFGSLDAQTRARMQDELAMVWEKRRTTVVMVTHDVDEAIHLADRVAVLTPRPGRLHAEVHVDIPRPRTFETRLSPAFAVLKRTVWTALGLSRG